MIARIFVPPLVTPLAGMRQNALRLLHGVELETHILVGGERFSMASGEVVLTLGPCAVTATIAKLKAKGSISTKSCRSAA